MAPFYYFLSSDGLIFSSIIALVEFLDAYLFLILGLLFLLSLLIYKNRALVINHLLKINNNLKKISSQSLLFPFSSLLRRSLLQITLLLG